MCVLKTETKKGKMSYEQVLAAEENRLRKELRCTTNKYKRMIKEASEKLRQYKTAPCELFFLHTSYSRKENTAFGDKFTYACLHDTPLQTFDIQEMAKGIVEHYKFDNCCLGNIIEETSQLIQFYEEGDQLIKDKQNIVDEDVYESFVKMADGDKHLIEMLHKDIDDANAKTEKDESTPFEFRENKPITGVVTMSVTEFLDALQGKKDNKTELKEDAGSPNKRVKLEE